MRNPFNLVVPRFQPPLDAGFRPAVLANRAFRQEVDESGSGVPLVLGLERADGLLSRYETRVFPEDHPRAGANLFYAERLLKFFLWQRGGWKVYVGGPQAVGEHLKLYYSPGGARAFDHRFMGDLVYQEPFTVIPCLPGDVPPEMESERSLGRHLDGCRIGFDLGASDLKVSAVVDGEAVYSQEIVWEPRLQPDPRYHYEAIVAAIQTAAAKMPRLDAIGGSAAGIYVDNQPMVASLFRGIPEERFGEVRTMFQRIRGEMGVPLEVVNDGEVTALAGSMSLEDDGVLGIALGSSQAGGYVTMAGNITGWLNELAFCPVDYSPAAPVEEWSGDRGCGALYFSQQCVFRLAPQAGIEIPDTMPLAEKLEFVQQKLEAGHEGARQIWQSMGVYLGYAIAHYAEFYDLKHVLILGRCTSGRGGHLILDGAREVIGAEFSELAARVHVQLPDEKSRRVGQAIAAASLPAIVQERRMKFHHDTAEVFVPDGIPEEEALARTTHLAIAAHQDDVEIMAFDGILRCFQREDRWCCAAVVTDGSGSPRDDVYRDYTDEEMQRVRRKEQKKAAVVGEYGALVLLDHPSSMVKDGADEALVADLVRLLKATRPRVVYTHNLADKHDTHVAVALRVVEAIRRLPAEARPERLYGCEVWRDLDWLVDADKVAFDLSAHENLQAALLGVFDSQICGGKRYDLATLGRRRANATYYASHRVDVATGMSFAMDLTLLIQEPEPGVETYVQAFIARFARDVAERLERLQSIAGG
jgi:LmbE family N-acetylglucosaminyl deacetylase/predicted NBD/HSP70 family sugar kinase